MHIPLNQPFWSRKEEKAAALALRNSIGTGDGPNSKILVEKLKKLTGAKFVFPVTSCTHGLELAMLALGIGPVDEVILPSFTMTATANCVVLRGATPVFAEIEAKYFCIDPADTEKKITKKTRAIIVVHYAGMGCQMEKIVAFAKRHKLFIVEDAAHAIGAKYHGKSLGTWGDIGVFSFHGTKNVACGEGGAILTNSAKLAKKIEILRTNGTNRNAFLRGEVAKYHWVDAGSSYLLSDILASIVNAQLEKLPTINRKREQIATYYTEKLARFKKFLALPAVPPGSQPNWHIFAIRFDTGEHADIFLHQMRAAGIEVSRHYVPLHSAPFASKGLAFRGKLPVTDRVYDTLIRLPIYPGLTKRELAYIVASAYSILGRLV